MCGCRICTCLHILVQEPLCYGAGHVSGAQEKGLGGNMYLEMFSIWWYLEPRALREWTPMELRNPWPEPSIPSSGL